MCIRDRIGTDTFIDNEVRLRKGPVYQCAENGGFGIFDEINMAKNDAVSVLHATLDLSLIHILDAATIVYDAVRDRNAVPPGLNTMFVTPKDTEETIKSLRFTISEALNIALS